MEHASATGATGRLRASPTGGIAQLPQRVPAACHLPLHQHPTQVTHLVSCVGCDGDSGGHTRCLSLGRAPGPRNTQETLSLGTDSQSQLILNTMLTCKKTKRENQSLPPMPGERQGARNMQRGFCLCSPVPGGGGNSWGGGRGALTAEDGEGTGQMRLEAWGWGGEEEDRKNSEKLMLGRAPAIIRAAPSVGCAHCGRRPFTSLTGWAPRNQPGGAEVTCLATSSVLVT